MLREVEPVEAPEWLARLTPEAWIRQGLAELSRAQQLLAARDRGAALLSLRRAAGMALNGALRVRWKEWGRTYVEHVRAVAVDGDAPEAVRAAARLLTSVELPREPNVVRLTPPSESAQWVEATKTLMAHAYAIVHGSAGRS
jgi:HEPN domain-containing protein